MSAFSFSPKRWGKKQLDDTFSSFLRRVDRIESTRRGGRFRDYFCSRSDGLTECFSVHTEEETLYLQVVLHFFPECPIPAGPFGFDGNVIHIGLESGIPFDHSLLWGADRIECSPSEMLRVRQLVADIRLIFVSTFDEWATQLLADPMLRLGAELSEALRTGAQCNLSYEGFVELMGKFGSKSLRGYPLRKVASHAYRRAVGDKKWFVY